MTATAPPQTTAAGELAQRNRIQAFRVGRYVVIVAEGDLPSPGFDVDIELSPIDIFPPQYDLLRRQRPGFFPQVIVPYRYGELVLFPEDEPRVTVHHSDGQDEVEIQGYGEDLTELAAIVDDQTPEDSSSDTGEAIGASRRLSFDEAFADAIDKLRPSFPQHPDALSRVEVAEISGLFGGIAGFHHLFVKVRHVGS